MELYQAPDNIQTRWASYENVSAAPGAGAKANRGCKGHAFDWIPPGGSVVLLDLAGSGTVRRIWMTVQDRSPQALQALRLEMYWDGSKEPAVSSPLGTFFCAPAGRLATFENELFASPEGRSFNCYIPMPFRLGARLVLHNTSADLPCRLFYDIDCTVGDRHGPEALYFHATYRRESPTVLGRDFEILSPAAGRGRFLGACVEVAAGPDYGESWWGEGEVKVFLDDDNDPTLVGTGTEDYIGTGWGQGFYAGRYQGCLLADAANRLWGFYRLHVPDPVYFHRNCRVTLQQIGGWQKEKLQGIVQGGAKLKPISYDIGGARKYVNLLDANEPDALNDPAIPADAWFNFLRQDDVGAVAYFYLDCP